jgi:peptidyl-Asp metalloendopeptidase
MDFRARPSIGRIAMKRRSAPRLEKRRLSQGVGVAQRNTLLRVQGARFLLIVGSTLLALWMILQPSLAQKEIFCGKGPVALTPAQQAVVDKITRSPETVNVGVIRKTDIKEFGPPENRYARVILPLSDGKEISLIRTRNTVKTERGFTWRGGAEETGERAIIMLWNDGHLSGYFAYRGRVFSVNHMGGDIHTVAELQLPPDHAPGPEPRTARLAPPEPKVAPFPDAQRKALEAKKITIDLMLLYTKNAADHYIGEPADLLAFVIEEANETFKRSGLGNISLWLVHAQLIDYDETGGQHFEHLYRMVDGVGPFKDVRKLRDEKRADIVGLILDSSSGCGLSTRVGADSEDAFFIAHHSWAGNTYTIVHEIGHLLGARHDRLIDANESPFAYAHGYVNGSKWRDVMSYKESCGGCPRLPYFSNPRINYKGEPTGTAATDNARVILEQAERVSKFR